ncbi:MAG TPA: hypothetical protein VGH86_02070 [Phenylobacterium sp.]
MRQLGLGLLLGLVFGGCGMALAHPLETRDGDHYQMGWTVLLRGDVVCTDPWVRPEEREIECRSTQAR